MFVFLLILIILQRLTELMLAKRNEKWMKQRGGVEYGREHYPYIVALHVLFLVSFIAEVLLFDKGLTTYWYIIAPIIVFTQVIRYWAVFSLGSFWNTRIIIIPNADVVSKGPYRFLKHPNYLVVALEILCIPLLFNAFLTSIMFTLTNVLMMKVRILAEERALVNSTNYVSVFQSKNRFLPIMKKTEE
ncbi:isoprenylcysteine carboxyl methyltransferase family protein [Metabacillus herbersteinensis]|uniref:Isoprenylcysteine carboxyl methyltransferase family protein n=1 Tax=Metabacillus herbersteinensis TaxID=283816 RepID=A0ABV6GE60_9BACI